MADGDAKLQTIGPFVSTASVVYPYIKVYHYAAGTSDAKTVWLDAGRTQEAPQPVVGDSKGVAYFYGDGVYKLVIKDQNGNTLYTFDNWLITSDMATMWENNHGTAYPSAGTANAWQLFLKHSDAGVVQELGVNNGTAFQALVVVNADGTVLLVDDIQTLNGPFVDVRRYGAVAGASAGDNTTAILAALAAHTSATFLIPEGVAYTYSGVTPTATQKIIDISQELSGQTDAALAMRGAAVVDSRVSVLADTSANTATMELLAALGSPSAQAQIQLIYDTSAAQFYFKVRGTSGLVNVWEVAPEDRGATQYPPLTVSHALRLRGNAGLGSDVSACSMVYYDTAGGAENLVFRRPGGEESILAPNPSNEWISIYGEINHTGGGGWKSGIIDTRGSWLDQYLEFVLRLQNNGTALPPLGLDSSQDEAQNGYGYQYVELGNASQWHNHIQVGTAGRTVCWYKDGTTDELYVQFYVNGSGQLCMQVNGLYDFTGYFALMYRGPIAAPPTLVTTFA